LTAELGVNISESGATLEPRERKGRREKGRREKGGREKGGRE
tara:strand:- start:189 stop:314 length:126 start_codon:yes stop_codon:yes gene_type:complete